MTSEQARQANRRNSENLKRIHEQRSGDEVPGFHARTVIDDTIGKLFALRQQLAHPLPDGLAALLDDVEELVERAVDLAFDPEQPEINDGERFAAPELMNWTNHLSPSGSSAIYWCSCGQPGIGC